jgi:hypothetical protein
MALPNIFSKEVSSKIIDRINQLTPDSQPQWGKMNVSQMLAHCCVSYEMVYEDKHPRPNAFMRFIIKNLAKKAVTNETPYKHNSGTAPVFLIKGSRDFATEKARLIGFINKTQQLGEEEFDGKTSHSFGKLSKEEWNNMFYKHVNHHLMQFGV